MTDGGAGSLRICDQLSNRLLNIWAEFVNDPLTTKLGPTTAKDHMPKQSCSSCHFLSKEHRGPDGRTLAFALAKEDRAHLQENPGKVFEHYTLCCHMGVWDEAASGASVDRDTAVNKTDRSHHCFYFPYDSAMLFGAAKELQRRQAENEQLKRSNAYTRVGLWVAAGALAVNVLIEFFKLPALGSLVKQFVAGNH